MNLESKPKRYRYPGSVISCPVWQHHRFNLSYRDVQEQLAYRRIIVSHETVRNWCMRFSRSFKDVLKKRERRVSDKWHLDEMNLRIKGEPYVLWRAVDAKGVELDIFLQRRRNKASAIRFLSRLLRHYDSPRVIVTAAPTPITTPSNSLCT